MCATVLQLWSSDKTSGPDLVHLQLKPGHCFNISLVACMQGGTSGHFFSCSGIHSWEELSLRSNNQQSNALTYRLHSHNTYSTNRQMEKGYHSWSQHPSEVDPDSGAGWEHAPPPPYRQNSKEEIVLLLYTHWFHT